MRPIEAVVAANTTVADLLPRLSEADKNYQPLIIVKGDKLVGVLTSQDFTEAVWQLYSNKDDPLERERHLTLLLKIEAETLCRQAPSVISPEAGLTDVIDKVQSAQAMTLIVVDSTTSALLGSIGPLEVVQALRGMLAD
jgi:CBS-domain-containing membrane protein